MDIGILTPRYVDSISMTVVDGLLQLGHKVYAIHHGPINYAESYPYDGEYVDLDLFIMADTDYTPGHRDQWTNICGKMVPKIIVHGHDRFVDYMSAPNSPIKPVPSNMEYHTLFVRDYAGDPPGNNVFPLDYGIERRYLEGCFGPRKNIAERPVDMMFYGTLSTAQREYYLQRLAAAGMNVRYGRYEFNIPDDYWSKWVYGRYTHDRNYYQALNTTKMVFCPYGAGCSCFRHMEAYAAKAIPVIQKYPDNIIPLHNFIDGENCILWTNEKDLVQKVKHYLDNEAELEVLQEGCWDFAMNNLTTKHVAQYMLDKIKLHGLI